MNDQHRPDRPLLARIFSLEGAMAAFGLYSLGSGLATGAVMPLFWGVVILVGLGILLAVRRRNWSRHWEELEKQRGAPPSREEPRPPQY